MANDTICPPNESFDKENYASNELLQDPYKELCSENPNEVTRFSSDVPITVLAKFKSIMPYRGAIQATFNTILFGLLAEFESQGIHNYDPTYKPTIVKIIKSRAFGEKK